jgi:uncharacterized repeat protein (TIGR03803 family)
MGFDKRALYGKLGDLAVATTMPLGWAYVGMLAVASALDITDRDGNVHPNLYAGKSGLGTVFKVGKKGNEIILYSFTGAADGGLPLGGVIFDKAGNLYGTTYIGGVFGVGTVYKLDPTGKEVVLYNFTGGADGKNPYFVVLVRDKAGNLYGTTSAGAGTGCGGAGCGTVFKLTP